MRKNLLVQLFSMLLLVSLTLTSCDWDLFGKEKNYSKGKTKLAEAKEKAANAANDVANAFDPNDPAYDGLSEEEIKAKQLETTLFQDVMEMQDNAMGKLSDLKKMQKNLETVKGSSANSGAGGNKEKSYSMSTSSKGNYQCPYAEEAAQMSSSNSGGGSSGGNGEVNSAIKNLKNAEASLYTFMNNFNKPIDLPHEEVVEYLEDEKTKMNEIKDQVDESMNSGEALLQTFE